MNEFLSLILVLTGFLNFQGLAQEKVSSTECEEGQKPIAMNETQPSFIHNLNELALRQGEKPFNLLKNQGGFAGERTIFHDAVTGAELWRITNGPGRDYHEYYDVPAWNKDGSALMVTSGIYGDKKQMLIAGDLSSLRTVDPSGRFKNGQWKWSWLNKNQLYCLHQGIIWRVNWTTGEAVSLLNLSEETGIPAEHFQFEVPHPLDDRLLFGTREFSRYFAVDSDGSDLYEIPTKGILADEGQPHRVRWTKSRDHRFFIRQKSYYGQDSSVLKKYVTFILSLEGKKTYCNIDRISEKFGAHPDATADGAYITGNFLATQTLSPVYQRSVWRLAANGDPKSARCIYRSACSHHSSNTWDGRWHLIDNRTPEGGPAAIIRGNTTVMSLALASLDGRAQIVLCYPYSSYGSHQTTHPHPGSSPDGTKAIYNSDMLHRGTLSKGAQAFYGAQNSSGDSGGNPDVYVAVIRRPFPPKRVSAVAKEGQNRLKWERPLHANPAIYWNPGNHSREVKGYYVLRANTSGGPYKKIHEGIITDTFYVDADLSGTDTRYYVILSVEHSGLVSLHSEEVCANLENSGWLGKVRHFYEVEYGELELPMVQQMDWLNTSGGWYAGTFTMEPDPDYPVEPYPARVAIKVYAPKDGEYLLWCRAASFREPGEITLEIAGKEIGTVKLPGGNWQWISFIKKLRLEAGHHEIFLSSRTPFLGMDMICLTDDAAFVPNGLGAWDRHPPQILNGLNVRNTASTVNTLTWEHSRARDIHHYNVYCGRTSGFDIGNSHLIGSPLDNHFVDWGFPSDYSLVYKVTAVDCFGNESQAIAWP